MKLLNIVALLGLFCLPACGEGAKAGDVMNKAGEAMKGLDFGKTLTAITSKLGSITDGKTAEAAKGDLDGMVNKLEGEMKEAGGLAKIGDKLGAMKGTVMKAITGLMGKADITKHIGPILTKLKGMIGG
ncbi:MAG: hypothetical protein AB8H80_01035 [Planctomycetota bacterium]